MRLRQPPRSRCARDGTYLVTGGIAGFGFAAARWLAAHGAGSIALLGRRGARYAGSRRARRGAAQRSAPRSASMRPMSPIAASLSAVLDDIRAESAAVARCRARRLGDRRRARRRSGRRRRFATILRPKLGGAVAARPPDPRRSDRAVPAVLLGDDPARRAGSGRLCRGESARSKRWRGGGGPRACRRSRSPGGRSRMPAIWRSGPRPAMRWRAGSAPSRCRRRKPWRRCRRCSPADLPVVALGRNQLERGAALPADPRRPAFRRCPRPRSGRCRSDDSLIERSGGTRPR